MLFADALKLLKDGEALVRDCWVETDGYLVLLQGMKHAWKIITNPAPNAGNHIFSVEELSADDWKVKPKASEVVCEATACETNSCEDAA